MQNVIAITLMIALFPKNVLPSFLKDKSNFLLTYFSLSNKERITKAKKKITPEQYSINNQFILSFYVHLILF